MAYLPATQNTVVYLFDVHETLILLLLAIEKRESTFFSSSKQEKPIKTNQHDKKKAIITLT